MTTTGTEMLSLNALVHLRIGEVAEFASRIEDVDDVTVVVGAPPGGSALLIASGGRGVHLSWVSPRGRCEQPCELVENIGGPLKRWRLRPTGHAVVIQRRRYVRVRAAVPVRVVMPGEVVSATTIDISEGGFRVRLPLRDVDDLTPAAIQTTIGGRSIEVVGYVLRSEKVDGGQTEAVIAFDDEGLGTDAIRRYVFQMQLRARAVRQS